MLQFAPIVATSSGENVIVTGSTFPNRRIMVISYTLITDTNVGVTWVSGATANLSGTMALDARGGLTVTSNFVIGAGGGPLGIFQTLAAEDDLILDLSGGATIGGHITYFVLNS